MSYQPRGVLPQIVACPRIRAYDHNRQKQRHRAAIARMLESGIEQDGGGSWLVGHGGMVTWESPARFAFKSATKPIFTPARHTGLVARRQGTGRQRPGNESVCGQVGRLVNKQACKQIKTTQSGSLVRGRLQATFVAQGVCRQGAGHLYYLMPYGIILA